jgi:hypothetical protein
MCRRFDPGPDHLHRARVFLGNPGEDAGLFVFRGSIVHVVRWLIFLAIPIGSRIYRCAFRCAQRRAGRGHVEEVIRRLHIVSQADRHAVADPLADDVLRVLQGPLRLAAAPQRLRRGWTVGTNCLV